MAMKALRDGAKGGITKFVLMGFLVMAGGSLVMMDVGGFFRGGVSSGDVVKIGDEALTIRAFDQNVRRTISRVGISPQEAYKAGYIEQILRGQIRDVLLGQVSDDIGLRVSNEKVTQKIQDIVMPMANQGQSPKDVLNQILASQGLSEDGFIASIKNEMRSELLAGTLQKTLGGVSQPVSEDLFRFQKETRDIEFIPLYFKDLKDIPKPVDEQLEVYYQTTKRNYLEEETRALKIVKINTEALEKQIEVSDAEVRNAYDDNVETYKTPKTWVLEQAVLSTQDEALAVQKAATSAKGLEAGVKAATGNSSAYLGEQSFTEATLIEDVKDAVLANEKAGEVLAPISAPLGYYVVRVKDIAAEAVVSFDDVKKELRHEILQNQIVDDQYDLANTVEDLLASGSLPEDIAQEVEITIDVLPRVNRYGVDADGKNALKTFGEDATTVLERGFELAEGETSTMFETRKGEIIGVYVDGVTPESYKTLDEVRKDLEAQWMKDQQRVGTRMLASQIIGKMNEDTTPLANLAKAQGRKLAQKKAISRQESRSDLLDQRAVSNIFAAPVGRPFLLDVDGGIAIASVTGFKWPEKIAKDGDEFKAFKKTLADNASSEGVQLYLQAEQRAKGIKVNRALLDQVYGAQEEQSY